MAPATPMPTFPVVERLDDVSSSSAVVVVSVVLVPFPEGVVTAAAGARVVVPAEEDIDVASPVVAAAWTTNSDASASHTAQTRGFDGRTSNLPTPVSQQDVVWSQQYEVSVLVTLLHDMRSVPPVFAPFFFGSLVSYTPSLPSITQISTV